MDGTPFGRYRLIELIGRGGMGEVWRAFDLAKPCRWLQAITARDDYSASGHEGAEKAVARADQALQIFTEHSVNIHDGGGSEHSP